MISIIVPVYQAEKYLDRCIKSVLNQTYKQIELILVDDGSTDGSAAICDGYAAKRDNVKVIRQSNAGVSSARNKGLDAACGDYVMFVDADDYIAPSLCEDLSAYIDENTDVIIAALTADYGESKKNVRVAEAVNLSLQDLKKNFDLYYKIPLLNSPCGKLYKRSVIFGVRFCAEVKTGEDLLFNLECYGKADNIKIVPVTGYYYNRTNTDSATKKFKEEYFNCYLKCYEEGKRFKYGEVKFTNDALDKTFCSNCLYFMQLAAYNVKNKKERRAIIKNVLYNPSFQSVCAGKYDFPLAVKIMHSLSKKKKFTLLNTYFAIKKVLSLFKR